MKLKILAEDPWGNCCDKEFPQRPRLFLESVQIPEEVKAIWRLANKNDIKLVMVGANAANVYTGRPRDTGDVDFVCDKPKRLIPLIRQQYPNLVIREMAVVYRIYKNGDQFIDIIKPYSQLILDALSKTSKYQGFVIPTLEVMVALKYASMISPHRDAAHKHQDASDFSSMIINNPTLKDSEVMHIASTVHEKAAQKVKGYIDDARAGRTLHI